MTSYDQGDFDERLDAQGLSGWYTQAPAAIAAQVTLYRFALHKLQCSLRLVHYCTHQPDQMPAVDCTMTTTLQVRLLLQFSPIAWLGLAWLGLAD